MMRNRVSNFLVLIAVVCAFLAAWQDASVARAAEGEKVFRAGAATSNITPPLGTSLNGSMRDRRATHIHDELHARCLVLDDGRKRLAIVLVDSCMIPRPVLDRAKQLTNKATGIPTDHMLMAATHTHFAPTVARVFQSEPDTDYIDFLVRRIADGVKRAHTNLRPARIGWAVGSEPNQVFNRRWFLKPGTMPENPFGRRDDKVKMNPGVKNPNLVKPAGPIDPEVPLISVQSADGRPLALLANYSLHYVGGPGHCASADYFAMFAGRMAELLDAEHLDPPFVGIMSNGTSADINNINWRHGQPKQPPYGQMRLVANAVADAAYTAYKTIQYRDWVPLDVRQTEIELGVRKPSAEEVAEAKAILAKAKGRALKGLREYYAKETVDLADYPSTVKMILQAMRIGDVGICAIPCEVFVEIGLELKAKSPLKPTFTIELANGYNGYLPTPEQHALGGYETWRAKSSYLETGASPKIVRILLGQLREMK